MRVVLERVSGASVSVEGEKVAEIGLGYLLYVGFTHGDTTEQLSDYATKITNLRVMEDTDGKLNLNVSDAGGQVLAVPNFTLYADTSSRRPGFKEAAKPDVARQLFDTFVSLMVEGGLDVKQGVFGAHMEVAATNDGPVTIVFDSQQEN